jgi:uncharacterized membrane-anchored protein YitT (DUF2179 family)
MIKSPYSKVPTNSAIEISVIYISRQHSYKFLSSFVSGTILDCILWETVASKFMEYCKNRTEEGPLILIIRHARLQKPTGWIY